MDNGQSTVELLEITLQKPTRARKRKKKRKEKRLELLTPRSHFQIASIRMIYTHTHRNRKKESKPVGPYCKGKSIKQGITSASYDYSQPCTQKNAGAKMFESHRQQQCNPPKSVQQGMIWP